ncbi:MAG TPA: beta-lactamase family protein [Rhodospirillaceae bacterium]|nr:beta-lactamase family protein [Rhodospirillaceae bacterium]
MSWRSIDGILSSAVEAAPSLPGVVAMLTDRGRTLYSGAVGRRSVEKAEAMTADTVLALFSCSKAVTATAVLQLVEDGLLDLDRPVRAILPDIAAIQVLDGFDDSGQPQLRAPKRDITTRMLLLHSSGFGYEFFNHGLLKVQTATGAPSVISGRRAALQTPLLFDPGEDWNYGIGLDWCGRIVETLRGTSLGEAMKSGIFDRLGMSDTGFGLTPDMRGRLASLHQRAADGGLTAYPDPDPAVLPEMHMGGHGLYGTAGDYLAFIRMWLNDGDGPHGRVLTPATVEMAVKDGLQGRKIHPIASAVPAYSHDVEMFPGIAKSWSLPFMVNDDQAPTGRPAGSVGWAGLANLFYWIDRRNGIGGFWATQLFPFADPAAITAYLGFETAVYDEINNHLQKIV